jgi:two-component system, NtrC family, response regulator HydG
MDTRSILIVDDNESLAKTMSFVLRRRGYDAVTARDGREAIEQAAAGDFDVILMDIKMPQLNGVEAYRKIKESRPGALVMMMTAYSVDDLVQQALAEGAYGVIYKPLDIEKVISLIERARSGPSGVRVLVVDDQPGLCTTLRNILARRGCVVSTASSGEDAIALAREQTHDLIFIDMKLPTIDGLQTYLAIKELRPHAVVIVMTAYREEMASRVSEALGACAYTCLYKPLDLENVLLIVDDLSERRHEPRTG